MWRYPLCNKKSQVIETRCLLYKYQKNNKFNNFKLRNTMISLILTLRLYTWFFSSLVAITWIYYILIFHLFNTVYNIWVDCRWDQNHKSQSANAQPYLFHIQFISLFIQEPIGKIVNKHHKITEKSW